MSTIGAISSNPSQPPPQVAMQHPAKPAQDGDEATESRAAKAAEAASPHKVNMTA